MERGASPRKGSGKGEGKTCSFYLTPKGCSKGRQCTFVHQYGKAKGESRCYNCGSNEHRQNACTRPQGPLSGGKGPNAKGGGKGSVQTPASGQGADPNLTNSGGQQTFTQQTPSPNPGPAAAQAPKVASTSTASSNIPQASSGGVATPGGVPPSIASAQAQVLEEAQKLLSHCDLHL